MATYNFKNPYNVDQRIVITTTGHLGDEFHIGHVAEINCPEVGMTFIVTRHAIPLVKEHCYQFHYLVHPADETTFGNGP